MTTLDASLHAKTPLLRGKSGYRGHPAFLMDSNVIGFHFLGVVGKEGMGGRSLTPSCVSEVVGATPPHLGLHYYF